MSQCNYKPAFCEELQARILNEFHKYRRENGVEKIDAADLMQIVGTAKLEFYQDRPGAEKAGLEIIHE